MFQNPSAPYPLVTGNCSNLRILLTLTYDLEPDQQCLAPSMFAQQMGDSTFKEHFAVQYKSNTTTGIWRNIKVIARLLLYNKK